MSELSSIVTGKRKNSIVRIKIKPGNGIIKVKGIEYKAYFKRESICLIATQSLRCVNVMGNYDIEANAQGGGLSGQAGAIRHAIAKALVIINPDYKKPLRKAGFLTRDSRIVERKKFGHKKARKSFQFSKR